MGKRRVSDFLYITWRSETSGERLALAYDVEHRRMQLQGNGGRWKLSPCGTLARPPQALSATSRASLRAAPCTGMNTSRRQKTR